MQEGEAPGVPPAVRARRENAPSYSGASCAESPVLYSLLPWLLLQLQKYGWVIIRLHRLCVSLDVCACALCFMQLQREARRGGRERKSYTHTKKIPNTPTFL